MRRPQKPGNLFQTFANTSLIFFFRAMISPVESVVEDTMSAEMVAYIVLCLLLFDKVRYLLWVKQIFEDK